MVSQGISDGQLDAASDKVRSAGPAHALAAMEHLMADASQRDVPSAPMIHRRKGFTPDTFAKTHGLPEPDGPLHKGSIFRMLLAPWHPGRMLDLGAGKGNYSLSAVELGW